jgi:hypothetical protein
METEGNGMITAQEEIERMQQDIDFLARRAAQAGSFGCDRKRDTGMSSNSIVGMAYGIGKQIMPFDMSDYAACVRAVRKLPKHRRTKDIMEALRKARSAIEVRYPRRKARAAASQDHEVTE